MEGHKYCFYDGSEPLPVISEFNVVPFLEEAFALAKNEIAKRNVVRSAADIDPVVFEILPLYRDVKGDIKPISGDDARLYRIDGTFRLRDTLNSTSTFNGFQVYKNKLAAAPCSPA